MRTKLAVALLAVASGVVLSPEPTRAAPIVPFPDVPPWHWAQDAVQRDQGAGMVVGYPATPAELAQNAIIQVYDGLAHAGATGAQAWVERFSYNRPADWPSPLRHAQIAQFSLNGMKVSVHDEVAMAMFTATVTTRQGGVVKTPMRVALRHAGQDWQVDYADLASGSSLFR